MQRNLQYGFTLLELLVVIAIIGLLAGIVLYATSDARFQGRATAMAAQMKQIERGFFSYKVSEGMNSWPTMPSNNYSHPDNHLNTLLDSPTTFPNLDGHIPSDPLNYSGSPYTYFNRGGSYVECTVSGNVITEVGPSIRMEDIDDRLFEYLDIIIDGTHDPDCGQLKRVGGSGSAYFDLSQT